LQQQRAARHPLGIVNTSCVALRDMIVAAVEPTITALTSVSPAPGTVTGLPAAATL
jgi:hypothetical protein